MMSKRHTGEPGEASQYISTSHPVPQSYIYQTPLVHDSPASRTQSSIEDLVPQTEAYSLEACTLSSHELQGETGTLNPVRILFFVVIPVKSFGLPILYTLVVQLGKKCESTAIQMLYRLL